MWAPQGAGACLGLLPQPLSLQQLSSLETPMSPASNWDPTTQFQKLHCGPAPSHSPVTPLNDRGTWACNCHAHSRLGTRHCHPLGTFYIPDCSRQSSAVSELQSRHGPEIPLQALELSLTMTVAPTRWQDQQAEALVCRTRPCSVPQGLSARGALTTEGGDQGFPRCVGKHLS